MMSTQEPTPQPCGSTVPVEDLEPLLQINSPVSPEPQIRNKNRCHHAIQSTPCRSVVLIVELDPSAERVQDTDGRKVSGVEQLILNSNIYKGDASETRSTISILN